MNFEQSIDIESDVKTVFSTYKNVSEWPEWDPETEESSIDGEFSLGTKGIIKPKGAPETKIELIEVTENRSFTVECRLPLCKMHFIHILQPNKTGTNLVNRIEFSGLLAPVFGRLIGKGINKVLPESLLGLKQHIEKT